MLGIQLVWCIVLTIAGNLFWNHAVKENNGEWRLRWRKMEQTKIKKEEGLLILYINIQKNTDSGSEEQDELSCRLYHFHLRNDHD